MCSLVIQRRCAAPVNLVVRRLAARINVEVSYSRDVQLSLSGDESLEPE